MNSRDLGSIGVNEDTQRLMAGMNTQFPPIKEKSRNPIRNRLKEWLPELLVLNLVLLVLLAIYIFVGTGASVWRRQIIRPSENSVENEWKHLIESEENVAVQSKFSDRGSRPDGLHRFENNYAWSAKYEMEFNSVAEDTQQELCHNFTKYSLMHRLTPQNHTHFNFTHFRSHMSSHHHRFLDEVLEWTRRHHSNRMRFGGFRNSWTLFPTIVEFCRNHTRHHWNFEWHKRKTQISPQLFAYMESLDNQWQGNTGVGLDLTCGAKVLQNGTLVSNGQTFNAFEATCDGFKIGGVNILNAVLQLAASLNITLV